MSRDKSKLSTILEIEIDKNHEFEKTKQMDMWWLDLNLDKGEID